MWLCPPSYIHPFGVFTDAMGKIIAKQENEQSSSERLATIDGGSAVTMSPEVQALLKNITGTRAAAGVFQKNIQSLKLPFVYHLLPHLMNDHNSLKPAFHMKSGKLFADVVIGIPTVKRDKENYLMITLSHLISEMNPQDLNSTLIVVMIGETDMEYVINTARQIENQFPKLVDYGLIEVISPAASYYPNFESLPVTLGDSLKRVKWRTKQNLDTIYLMAYAQSKGVYYLMLEDDVIAKKNYMQDMKDFAAVVTLVNPDWFYIEFCHIGGIGKFFKSTNLVHFITYVQLFYNNMPIDWLLESYLSDKVCTIEKNSDSHFGVVPTFYPHQNPPLRSIRSNIKEQLDHTLKKAYEGESFFWGFKPKVGDYIEFWFEKPTALEKYMFRSGNVEHVSDKFYDTNVEILPVNDSNFTVVGKFDEFGLAESELRNDLGPLSAIRLIVNRNSHFWAILSEEDIISAKSAPYIALVGLRHRTERGNFKFENIDCPP
ncbi:unnamed protein product [Diatraea saccharalis]|uniref:Alpha-1,3-mannosyl-glycoprotein 4-beta-N-acetylglucosaminyltransferase A n=1 Tax=Diatraea saccharalis TaxID=40085 RepID=A0A9N9MZF6_9NEOP|nr:unnamed protein product [Diatraea saccharalis]